MKNSFYDFTGGSESPLSYLAYKNSVGNSNSKHKEKLEYMIEYIMDNYLSLTEKTALILYYSEGINTVKIAALLSRDKSTVSRNLSRARKKLEHYLALIEYERKIDAKLSLFSCDA